MRLETWAFDFQQPGTELKQLGDDKTSAAKCYESKRFHQKCSGNVTLARIVIRVEILRLRLDVEPLPHKGFRPGELQMNKQGRASRSKTQQTEQQDPAQIEVKPSKYLALLVALFPHCLIPPRPQQWKNPRPSLPLLGPQTRQGAPSAERILKSRTNFSSRQDSDPGSRKSWTESTDCRV